VLNGLGVELVVLDLGQELLRDVHFDGVLGLRLGGENDVDSIGLGGDDVSVEGSSRSEVELTVGALVDGDGRNLGELDLEARSVDNLAGGDGIIENNNNTLATIDGDSVELTIDLDHGLIALVDVDGLLEVSDIDGVLSTVVVLDNPLVTLEGSLSGTLLGSSLDGSGGLGSSRGGLLNNGTLSLEGGVLVNLHIIGNLAETRGNVARVELSEDGRGSSGAVRLATVGGGSRDRRRRRGSRGGRGSRGSTSGRGSRAEGVPGRESIATGGLPGETSGVVGLNVLLELTQEGAPALSPGNLSLILTLEVLEDTVGVELSTTDHITDERSRSGSDGDPVQSTNTISDGREVVEDLGGTALVLQLTDGASGLDHTANKLLEISISGLLALGGNNEELTLLGNGLLEVLSQFGQLGANGLGGLNDLGDVIGDEGVEGNNEGMIITSISRSSSGRNSTSTGTRASTNALLDLLETSSNVLEARNDLGKNLLQLRHSTLSNYKKYVK